MRSIDTETAQKVVEMLNEKVAHAEIAQTLGISVYVVHNISSGRTWRKTYKPTPRNFTQPFLENTNANEEIDITYLGSVAQEIINIKEQMAKGVKRKNIAGSAKIYRDIKRGKYMRIRPELNSQIY